MKQTTVVLVTAISLFCSIATPASFAASLAASAGTAAVVQPVAPEQLDKLLAPIALYPDPLVLQILQCAASPEEVKKVNEWLKKNQNLKGTALQDAATAEGFEPSYVAILLFPQVLQTLADKPDWTRDLGKAFAADRDGVFASVQRLRTQAQAVGNLKSNEQQQVETVKTSSGQDVIVIQPANPQVVYVPTYNPTVVYTQAPPPPPPGQAAAAGLVGFTAGIIIGAAIADDNPYYGCGGWGYHGPVMCSEGWNDYADHRQDMANDYYQHRENMASQRGQNQSTRQDSKAQSQAGRQDASAANQAGRQDARASGQAATGQAAASQSAGGGQTGRASAGAASRGAAPSPSASPADRSGTKSGALSGYQSGAKEREASSRGRSSASGGSRGGGGRGR